MSDAPERIWVEWPYANKTYSAFTDPPESEYDEAQEAYIRIDLSEAAIAAAKVEGVREGMLKAASVLRTRDFCDCDTCALFEMYAAEIEAAAGEP